MSNRKIRVFASTHTVEGMGDYKEAPSVSVGVCKTTGGVSLHIPNPNGDGSILLVTVSGNENLTTLADALIEGKTRSDKWNRDNGFAVA